MDTKKELPLSYMVTDLTFRNQVFYAALHYAGSHRSASSVRQLERLVNSGKIQLNGFSKSPFQAITTPRIKELATKLAEGSLQVQDTDMFAAVLRIWVEANPSLATTVRAVCADQGVALAKEPRATVSPSPQHGIVTNVMRVVTDRFPEASSDSISLMTAALTGILDTASDDAPIQEPPVEPDVPLNREDHTIPSVIDAFARTHEGWPALLAWLRTVPAESTIWDQPTIETFRADLKQLTEEKHQEHSGRMHVTVELEHLRREASEQIVDLELNAIDTWSANHCPSSEVAAVAEQLNALLQLLVQWRDRGSAPKRPRERDEWLTQQQALEGKIAFTHDLITEHLVPPPLVQPSPDGFALPASAQDTAREAVYPHAAPADLAGEPEVVKEFLPTIPPDESALIDGALSLVTEDSAAPTVKDTPAEVAQAVAAPDESTLEAPTLDQVLEGVDARPDERDRIEDATELVGEQSMSSDQSLDNLLAESPHDQDAADSWLQFMWSLIAEDDSGGAYWLARAMIERQIEPPLSPNLLQVLVGSRWLLAEPDNSGALAADIAAIANNYKPYGRDDEVLLGLAAAMLPALRAPASALLDWVDAPDFYPALRELAGMIREFASQGLLLRDEELRGFADQNQVNNAIKDSVEQVRRWMDSAGARRTGYARASSVWRELVSRGDLHDLAATVCKDQREKVQSIRQQIRQWRDRTYVISQIRTLDRSFSKSGTDPIDGDARDQLLRDVSEACDMIEHWCDQVDRGQQLGGRDSVWLLGQIRSLRDSINNLLPEVGRTLSRLQSESPSFARQAATRYLHRRLGDLCTMLGLPIDVPTTDDRIVQWNNLRSGQPEDEHVGRGLTAILGRRLWSLPGVAIGNDGMATAEGLRVLPEILRDSQAEQCTVEQIIKAWRTYGDFRWIETLRALIPDLTRSAEINRESQDALQIAVINLKRQIDEAKRPLEMAVFAGDIDDEARSRLEGVIERIDPVRTRNFAQIRRQLQDVEAEIERERERRVEELRERWLGLRLDLAARLSEDIEYARISQTVETTLERRNTWEINEALALVDRIIQVGAGDDPLVTGEETGSKTLRDIQQSFLEHQEQIEEALRPGLLTIINAVRNREMIAGFSFAQRPDAAMRALEMWRQLRGGAQIQANGFSILLKDVLEFLGFENASVKLDDTQQSSRREVRIPHVTMSLPTGRGRPLPQISGVVPRQYDVLILWGDRDESLRTQLQRVSIRGAQPLILIYLGSLKSVMRRDVARLSRDRPLLVLDEVMFLMLAAEQERDTRFKIWLQYCLPYTTINPYVPNVAGDVPAEIFYGRHEEVHDLADPNGSCLVYGGRQLGKSALLTAVKRLFHHPERNQYAWIENIDLVGDREVNQSAHVLWEKIRSIFRDRLGIIRPFRAEKPEDIPREVSRYMMRHLEAKVLLLFDEADDFLDDDAEGRFQVVVALRQIMQETNRRFKVVFTGLHDVQRFASIPNQPLAHFGKPICIGPLPPSPARDLITQPIEALGYRFEPESIVFRILSYTNYHAGLIQIFCHELLKQLQRPQRTTTPPFLISQREVDSAYLAVRDSIRTRFELTLNLDTRYRALALALIVDQLNSSDGFARAYQASTALSHAQAWWPAGFEDTNTDEAQGLLDEMCGLGVLIRTTDGGYRLRSPNLVRLLGNTKEIGDALDQMSKSRPPSRAERDTYHMPLDAEGKTSFSPLTYGQERTLHQAIPSVCIIFGSELNKLSLMPTVLERFAPTDLSSQSMRVLRISASMTRPATFLERMRAEVEQHSQYERLIFSYQPMSSDLAELVVLVRDALSLSSKKRAQRPIVKVVFLFGAAQSAAWMQMASEQRMQLERQITVMSLHRWTPAAVRKRLQLRELNDGEESLQTVLRATGNWQLLLDTLFEYIDQTNDLRQAAELVGNALHTPASELALRVRLGREFQGNPDLIAALNGMCENASGRVGMIDLLEYLQIPPERGEMIIIALERLGLIDRQDGDVVLGPLSNLVMEEPDAQPH